MSFLETVVDSSWEYFVPLMARKTQVEDDRTSGMVKSASGDGQSATGIEK